MATLGPESARPAQLASSPAGSALSGGSSLPPNRGLERALEEAAASGALNLSARKLKEFPRTASNHDLTDTVEAALKMESSLITRETAIKPREMKLDAKEQIVLVVGVSMRKEMPENTNLSKNRLTDVPSEVCHLVALETLNLYHNCIRTIPDSIIGLQSLTSLNLSRNQLGSLPACLCGLPLRVLNASNNKLVSLPETIGQLQGLMELDISCNEITALPRHIGRLKALRELNVRRNLLCVLPEDLADLPLVKFDFSCNKVSTIPVCYRKMKQLQSLQLENNPLQSPPAQICIKGKVHIFKYLSIEACRSEKMPDSLYLPVIERLSLSRPTAGSLLTGVPVVQVCFGPGSGATGSGPVWAVCPWWKQADTPACRHAVRLVPAGQVFMVLRENSAELNLSFNFKVDGFSYMVFATSETMKCFGCGAEGHLIRSCPEGAGGRRAAAAAGEGFFTRNVTRDMTRSMRDLEIQLVELQSRAESTGDRGLLNSLKSKKRALANLLGVAAEEDLLEVFNDCLERGRLPLSCRRAVITLLPKKGDLQELKNWRPVSLLCTDYKIMSKVLASRLREAVLVDFFWDRLHWVPQSILFLPKEEGGQGSGPSSQQGRCLPPTVLTETPHRTCRPGLEAFILLHLAEVWWSETGSGSVPDGLQESGHFISASVLQKCFLSVDFTEEAEEGTGRLSVLALTGTGTVWRVSGLSQLEWTHFVQTTESCRYTRQHKKKCQILNFVLGQAKMAVYLSRRRKVEEDVNIDVVPVFVNMCMLGVSGSGEL
ncbi:hypothetical protein L3Q82_004226 [Scortum barcoo]|uniref:Uncharacterized protein n=1 Tax=Scortum barcoo TaxID=214431 RepID=A0ACB8VJR0_9TELE|nr:hypothetical protein L3Q82_004226 [Scortum barcoo]